MASHKKSLKALVIYVEPALIGKIDEFVATNKIVEPHFRGLFPDDMFPTTRAALTRVLLEGLLHNKHPSHYKKSIFRTIQKTREQIEQWGDLYVAKLQKPKKRKCDTKPEGSDLADRP